MAVFALAKLCALQSRAKALAVFLTAHGFLARAFADGCPSRHSKELARVTVVRHHLCLQYLTLVSSLVVAAGALAGSSTLSPVGETFTVEFETSNFGAFAAMMSVCFLGLLVHSGVFHF